MKTPSTKDVGIQGHDPSSPVGEVGKHQSQESKETQKGELKPPPTFRVHTEDASRVDGRRQSGGSEAELRRRKPAGQKRSSGVRTSKLKLEEVDGLHGMEHAVLRALAADLHKEYRSGGES